MKKGIYILALLASVCWSCQEEGLKEFEDTAGSVYFYIDEKAENREMNYSFVYTYDKEVVVKVPVKCSGLAAGRDRYFRVEVVKDSTTASAGKHYAVPEEAVFPAGVYDAFLPVTLYNHDEILDTTTLDLTLRLVASSDFELGEKSRRMARIRFSNRLERPEAWQDWMFGPWSRVKHKRLVQIAGRDFPSMEELNNDMNYWMYGVGYELKNYFMEHYPVLDENNEVIESW